MTISARSVSAVISLLVLCSVGGVYGGFFSRFVQEPYKEDGKGDGRLGQIIIDHGIAYSVLRNNSKIPLVGYGVGNLHQDAIATMVAEAIQDDKRTRLIDTSQVSGNEALVAQGILDGVARLQPKEKVTVHVVTKVWYTHLGYARTEVAFQDSLKAFDRVLRNEKVNLRLHILLHWPQCYDSVHFMDCEGEEEQLPVHVKAAGPDPSQDTENAWKESWKMLEDAYLSKEYPIESIGVSNFHVHHLEEFDTFARVRPRMLQANLWSLVYDEELVRFCDDHGIHIEAFNIIEGTLLRPEKAPHAYNHIQKVAVELSRQAGGITITPAQVLFAWLIQHGISVVPRTSSKERLMENSGLSISSIPILSEKQVETVAHAVEAYFSEQDLEADIPVNISFHATTKDMVVYWVHNLDEIKVALVRTGNAFNETTYPGHVYRLYDAQNKDVYMDHVVQAHMGYNEVVHVDLAAQGLTFDSKPLLGSLPGATASQKNGNPTKPAILNWLGGALQRNK